MNVNLGEILLEIRADARGLREGLEQVQDDLERLRGQTERAGRQTDQSAASMAASYAAIAAAATAAFRIVVKAIDAGIHASERYKGALIGLSSVAQGRGIGAEAMLQEVDELTDAFFDAAAASTALKNLLSRGYTLDQAVNSIKRLKDAAAFGRQASYSLAEAVVTATEGLKNENSVLVDNAGVTKNVAKMWEEYAKSIGVGVQNLTMAQKIEAEYQGIMQETAYQVGDLQKSMDTLSGKQAEAANSALLLAQAYGEAMTPAVSTFTAAKNSLLEGLTSIVRQLPVVTAGFTTTAMSVTAFAAAIGAAKTIVAFGAKLKAAAASVTIFGASLNAAMPWLLGLSAAIGGITALLTANAKHQEEQAKAIEEATRKERERIRALEDSHEALGSQLKRVEELSGKKRRTIREDQELADLQNTLQSQLAGTGETLGELADSYEATAEAARKLYQEQSKELAKSALKDLMNHEIWQLKHGVNEELTYNKRQSRIAELTDPKNLSRSLPLWREYVDLFEEWNSYLLTNKGIDLDNTVKGRLDPIIKDAISEKAATDAGYNIENAIKEAYNTAFQNIDISPAVEALDRLNKKILSGAKIDDSQMGQVDAYYKQVKDYATKLSQQLAGDDSLTNNIVKSLAPIFSSIIDGMDETASASQRLNTLIEQNRIGELLSEDAETAAKAYEDMREDAKKAKDAMIEYAKSVGDEGSIINALQRVRAGISTGETDTDAYKAYVEMLKEYGVTAPQSLEEADRAIDNHVKIMLSSQSQLADSYQSLGDSIGVYKAVLADLEDRHAKGEEGLLNQIALLKGLIAELDEARRSVKDLALASDIELKIDVSDLDNLQENLDKATKEAGELRQKMEEKVNLASKAKEVMAIAEAYKKTGKNAEEFAKAQEWIKDNFDISGASAEEMGTLAGIAYDNAVTAANRYQSQVHGLMGTIQALLAQAAANPSLNINASPAIAALQALANVYNSLANSWFGRLFGWKPVGVSGARSGGGSRGGGGSRADSPFKKAMDALRHEVAMGRAGLEQELKKLKEIARLARGENEQREIAEAIYNKTEEIRQKNLEKDYDAIDHKKALNQLTIQQEINALEAIGRRHKMSVDERQEWEEKLYEAKKRRNDEEIDWAIALIDHKVALEQKGKNDQIAVFNNLLSSAELTAEKRMELEERVFNLKKELLEKEENAQKESLNSVYTQVQNALKKRLKSEQDAELERLDARIKALDAETEAENEAMRRKTFAESLQEKQRQLAVEKSARKRRQLEKDIADMQEKEDLRRLQYERQDEKSLLLEQRKQVQDRYAMLMEEENIRQEALRLVMSKNLDQMTALIQSYGEPWKRAGEQLAEYLTAGIIGGGTGIFAAIQGVQEQLEEAAKRNFQAIASSIPAISAGSGVVVNLYGMTVREEADIDRVANAIYQRIR